MRKILPFFLAGCFFGVVLTRAEVISWYRIQEMFRFRAFHMYGVLMSGAATAALSLLLLRRAHAKSRAGEPMRMEPKILGKGRRYVIGGVIFGVGWAFTGACPGPLFALLGAGVGVMAVTLVSALLGTLLYGWLRPRLPH